MFRTSKIAGLIAVAISLSACVSSNNASQNVIVDVPRVAHSENSTAQTNTDVQLAFFAEPTTQVASLASVPTVPSQFNVVDVQVAVPEYLVVSEADVYLPQADIVWREDPLGDRRAQVKTIMENALRMGTNALAGPREVVVVARVNMFHALTEKARNSVGGKHNVQFDYVLLDAQTKQPITTVQNIDASLKAYGGSRAYRAVRRGETQKVRISNHVAAMMQNALRAPSL